MTDLTVEDVKWMLTIDPFIKDVPDGWKGNSREEVLKVIEQQGKDRLLWYPIAWSFYPHLVPDEIKNAAWFIG